MNGMTGSLFQPSGNFPYEKHVEALIKLAQVTSDLDNAASFEVRRANASEKNSARLALAKGKMTQTAIDFFQFEYQAMVYNFFLNGKVVQVNNIFVSSPLLTDEAGSLYCFYVYTGGNRDALGSHTDLTSLGLKRDSAQVRSGQEELRGVFMGAFSDFVTNMVESIKDGQVDMGLVLAVCGEAINAAVSAFAVMFLLVGCGSGSGVTVALLLTPL